MKMLDKSLIKKNFQKSIGTYEKNALVQKGMATTLINLIKQKNENYNSILEIGSYSGILTRKFLENYSEFENYFAIDLVNSFEYIKNLDKRIKFQQIDFEKYNTNEKFDLIISNATLQWANDFFEILKKYKSFLNNNGVLAVSTFSKENMFEIKDVFNIGLKYYSVDEILEVFPNACVFEDAITMQFKNPIDILKHLKYSGVNSIVSNNLSYKEIKNKLKVLEEKYDNKITYKPLYIILK